MNKLIPLCFLSLSLIIISCSSGGSGSSPSDSTPEIYDVTVSISPSDAGSISPSADSSYEAGSEVNLQANPAQGWRFDEWQGDLTDTKNPVDITVDNSMSITAVFEKNLYALSIATSGGGSVSKNPDQTEYEPEQEVTLTANPDSDWEFEKWDGDITSTNNPITISMDSAITATVVFANSNFAGGNGTQKYPYEVSTLDQLQAVKNYPASHFTQVNDIDASATSTWNGGAGFYPIGDDVLPFTGSYNGQSFEISNLIIDRRLLRRTGLFGNAENAKLEAISLVDANITGAYFTAGLVGYITDGKILNSSVSGIIEGARYSGGLIGRNTRSPVLNSTVNADISGSVGIGGLIGQNSGNVNKSSFNGSVIAFEDVGGLVGDHRYQDTKISNSFSDGEVKADGGKKAGGLVGRNTGIIVNSYSLSNVSGDGSIGGMVGANESNGVVSYSYATGNISGSTDIGGIVGTNAATIEFSFWDTESSNQSNSVGRGSSDGTTGLTTSEMTGSSAETNMPDFDWTNIWVTTSSYPALFWE